MKRDASMSVAHDLIVKFRRVGIELTATPLADGSVVLGRWTTIGYWANCDEADAMWAAVVDGDSAAIEALKAHLLDGSVARTKPRP